jgi:hypothetical protein
MFERFLSKYSPDDAGAVPRWTAVELAVVTDLAEILGEWGGISFNSGLYRLHSEASSHAATAAIRSYLQDGWNDAIAFAFDWLGRNFVVSPHRWSDQNPLIHLVDVGEGSVFEVPMGIAEFHDVELTEHAEDTLAVDWFLEWRAAHNNMRLEFNQCVGYRKPLFLGGTDADENLEIADVEVYWSLMSQIYGQVKHLSEGTPIGSVTIESPPRGQG